MGVTLIAFGRMIMVLVLIVGLLVMLSRFAQKYQHKVTSRLRINPPGAVEVLSRRSLGKNSALLVIKVAQRVFLVSQSAQQLSLLTELESNEWISSKSEEGKTSSVNENLLAPRTALVDGEDPQGAWDAFIYRLREITVRH